METLTVIYLSYTFVAFYFLFIYLLLYLQNRDRIFEVIKPRKSYSLSIVVPCYNEGDSIGENIEAFLSSDYPGLKQIIVVDDCSKDNSFEIIKKYAKKYPGKVVAKRTPKNTGCAGGAKNYGAKFVKTELIGFSDADSIPSRDAISKMVGFFNDSRTGAVTSRVLVRNRKNKLEKMQSIEYKVIAFERKLLGFIESIYVTNGPLSIYRMEAYRQVGGFDVKNLTEDIEITWNFVKHGWRVHMAVPAQVYTIAPSTVRDWFKQRVRWNVGGVQTLMKYRKYFIKCGMLGLFIMPFFTISWILGITGLFFLLYRTYNYISLKFLIAKYSIASNVPIVTANDFVLNPTILFYFGAVLLIAGFMYMILAISYSREKNFPRTSIIDIFIYSIFYLLMYPPLLVYSFYKYLRGKNTW